MVRRLSRHEAAICFKLYRNRCFGKGHMLVDNVVRGFPSHEVGRVRDAIGDLVRDAILVRKPSRHGEAVFIDPSLRLEVYERIREHPDYAWLPK